MERREFITTTAAAGLGAAAIAGVGRLTAAQTTAPRAERFTLDYAPHFGMFRHHAGSDPVAQLEFMADEGFRALEDNGMNDRSPAEQELIATAMDRLGMRMGVFVAHADFSRVTFASPSAEVRESLLGEIRESIETAGRVKARWCTVVPGRYDQRMAWEYQTANVVENLKRCAELCEEAGLTMVLEPLNALRDHPGLFLTKIPQAYQICRAVDSPACKILDDLYHQQITEGNLIPNIDAAWSEIGYYQIGDNPGRNEPTTGEINFRNVFRHLHRKGYRGILGMEHGVSGAGKAGERAVIEAYRACDDF